MKTALSWLRTTMGALALLVLGVIAGYMIRGTYDIDFRSVFHTADIPSYIEQAKANGAIAYAESMLQDANPVCVLGLAKAALAELETRAPDLVAHVLPLPQPTTDDAPVVAEIVPVIPEDEAPVEPAIIPESEVDVAVVLEAPPAPEQPEPEAMLDETVVLVTDEQIPPTAVRIEEQQSLIIRMVNGEPVPFVIVEKDEIERGEGLFSILNRVAHTGSTTSGALSHEQEVAGLDIMLSVPENAAAFKRIKALADEDGSINIEHFKLFQAQDLYVPVLGNIGAETLATMLVDHVAPPSS